MSEWALSVAGARNDRHLFVVAAKCYENLNFVIELVRNLMAPAQKPQFVFRLNGRVHLNRRGSQFSRLLAAEVCASALVMLDTPPAEVV